MERVLDRNYEGKKVFVGLDVHKERYAVWAVCDGVKVKNWSCTSNPESLATSLNDFFKGAEIFSAYEAGFSGYRLHRVLCKQGIKSIVVNAASISVESNNRVKTDKRDARKIAQELSHDRLRCIYIPSEREEAFRSLSRGRDQAVRRRKSISNQLKGKLHYLGIPFIGKRVGEPFLKWVEELTYSQPEHAFAIKELVCAWREEAKRIVRFEAELKKQASNDKLEEIYRSAPGIGPVTSRILSNELGDMSRFKNERELFSSTGLTPSEFSSGEHTRKGSITRQGSSRIRGILIEVAWRAISMDESLKEFYFRLAATRGSKRAITAVARKLIGRLRKCLTAQIPWEDQKAIANAA